MPKTVAEANEILTRVRLGQDVTDEEAQFLVKHLSMVLNSILEPFQEACSVINEKMMMALGAMAAFTHLAEQLEEKQRDR